MLSRLASRGSSVAARSLSARPLSALPTLRRNFNSSTTLKSAAPAAPATGETEGPASLIQKYGATSFWGAVAAILVSKEVFILDAEFLLSCEIGLFALTGYVLTGDTFEKWNAEEDKKQVDAFNDANDFLLEMFTQYKLVQQTAQHKPEVMQQYLESYKSAVIENAKFQTVKPQHASRASVLATLQGIQAREEHAAAQEWQDAVDKAVANVTAAFTSGNKKLASETLDLAIGNIGTSPSADQKDPVKKLFIAEFAK